jgi:organic hydroperoxide reductase OsmC/OhrA
MAGIHHYKLTVQWTGNKGNGTAGYRAYNRDHLIIMDGKPELQGSSDPAFLGDKTKHSPEDLLVASLSACHMLWYLHVCADAGIVVTGYVDNAAGIMAEAADGSGHFKEVNLYPVVTVAEKAMIEKANALHEKANRFCFIARSVNFPVKHFPSCTAG